jgi:hypothetical protein
MWGFWRMHPMLEGSASYVRRLHIPHMHAVGVHEKDGAMWEDTRGGLRMFVLAQHAF